MTHVLVTFLGAPDRSRPLTQHPKPGYQEIDYKFSDAEIYRARLSPLALLKYLRGKAKPDDLVLPPNALVVFGTSGSAWHELMLCACGCWPDRDSIDRLIRRSHADSLTADDLKAFQDHDLLKSVLGVTSVRLELLPYADKAGEQVAIIAALNDAVKGAKAVTIDVTHGLRYLPLLGSLSAFVLMSGKAVKVEGVWYGALDMRTPDGRGQEQAPMIRLEGLSGIVDWLAAFKNFEWDGDFSGFAPLLEEDGMAKDTANLLHEAAFFEGLGNFDKATECVKSFIGALPKIAASGLTGLFKDQMLQHLQRFESEDFYLRQRRMAKEALDREDLPRAALWASEAAITRVTIQMKGRGQCKGLGTRNGAKSDYGAKYKQIRASLRDDDLRKKQREAFDRLLLIRNEFAHVYATESQSQVASALASKTDCHKLLATDINEFLTKNPEEPRLL